MKRYAIISVLFAMWLALPGTALAIEEGDIGFSFTIGQFGPTSDVADEYNNALGFAGQIGYFVEDVLSINLGTTYANFDSREGDGSAGVLGFYLMPEFIQPVYDYFLPGISLGAGFYQASADVPVVNGSGTSLTIDEQTEKSTVFGLNGGLNIRFLLGERFLLGINSRYHMLFPYNVRIADDKPDTPEIDERDFDIASDFYHIGLEIGIAF
jgi:Outer membrane protein beta-barrel domain